MKTRTKTSLLLIGTFVLGLVLGHYLTNFYNHQKYEKMKRSMRSPDWMRQRFETIIQPTEDQQAALNQIFQKHHKKMMKYESEFPLHMDTLMQDIKGVLSESQWEILEKERALFLNKHRRRRKWDDKKKYDHKRNPKMPPPPPPPPE